MLRVTARLLLLLVFFLVLPSARADACRPFQQLGTLPPLTSSARYSALAYGDGVWVAVGGGGAIAVSSAGTSWQLNPSPGGDADLHDVVWADGRFLVVGDGVVLQGTSSGSSWAATPIDQGLDLYAVAWSGQRWVAVGADGAIVTSEDGASWTTVSSPASASLRGVAWGSNGFVAVGDDGQIATSSYGLTWDLRGPVAGFGAEGESLVAIAADHERYVAVGGGVASLIVSSADGVGWTVELVGAGGRDWLRDVASGAPGFLAVGALFGGSTLPVGLTSADGRQWKSMRIPGEGDAIAAAWGDGRWMVLAGSGPSAATADHCFESWLQVAANLPGASSSKWRTNLGVRNANSRAVVADLVFDPAGQATQADFEIPAGSQVVLEDVVGQIFQRTGKAPLVIRSDLPLAASARLFNSAPEGSYGQSMPAFDAGDAIRADCPQQLVQLRQLSGTARTNIQLTNIGEATTAATVELYADDGTMVDRYEVTIAPGELVQDLQPFVARAGRPDLGWGFAVVTAADSGAVVATASVIDERTNDPTTVQAVPLGSCE